MAASCVTPAAFLAATGTEFTDLGVASTGTVTVASVGSPAETITVGGVALTAVAGARTPGSDDFSLSSGTVLGVAQSIVDAVNDAANSFATLVTATLLTPGLPVLQLTSVSTGYHSTLPFVTDAPAVYDLDPDGGSLSGGEVMVTTILDSTCAMLGPCWGTKKSWAHIYLAAHFATISEGGAGGPVSSRSIDKISESYAIQPPSDPDLGSTKWGLLYLALRATVPNIGATSGEAGRGLGALYGVYGVGRWTGGWYP